MDLQQQAIEICRLRLWLSLVVDYDIGLDPFTAERSQFRDAINRISQLPNLEMNFRRGDSLLDMISGVPIRVDSGVVSQYRDHVDKIQKLGRELHKARKAERKKKLRIEILRRRLDLSDNVLSNEVKSLETENANLALTLFGELGKSENERRKQIEHEAAQLRQALDRLQSDRKALKELEAHPMAGDFQQKLRKLEGADFDSPFNFVWQIDFADVFTSNSVKSTITGDLNLGDELAANTKGGFDLMVGNPPFVTARNPKKRELYRERWKRVCRGKYLLICPFFDLSFGLLKPDGELGFIVSNAFAKREFGQPLIEDFFPTVDLQKIVGCSGLLFPGHGTPTCIVFGVQRKPDKKTPIRVVATLPGGGDLRTPPEESLLWRTLQMQHNQGATGPLTEAQTRQGFQLHFENTSVVVGNCDRKRILKHPCQWTFVEWPTFDAINERGVASLRDFLAADIGFDAITTANDIYILSADALRRFRTEHDSTRGLLVGEMLRNYEADRSHWILWPFDGAKAKPRLTPPVLEYLTPFRNFLEVRSQFKKTQLEARLEWFEFREYHRRALAPCLTYAKISTHIHVYYSEGATVCNEHAPVIKPADGKPDAAHLIAAVLNSSTALIWLKQICFNKGKTNSEIVLNFNRERFNNCPCHNSSPRSCVASRSRWRSD